MFVPRTRSVAAYLLVTLFGRDQVPARPDNSYETRLALAAFASQGYVVSALTISASVRHG